MTHDEELSYARAVFASLRTQFEEAFPGFAPRIRLTLDESPPVQIVADYVADPVPHQRTFPLFPARAPGDDEDPPPEEYAADLVWRVHAGANRQPSEMP